MTTEHMNVAPVIHQLTTNFYIIKTEIHLPLTAGGCHIGEYSLLSFVTIKNTLALCETEC